MWLLFTLICLLGWGFADLFYKKSSDSDDKNSHLKIAVWVGIVMGVCAFALLPLAESSFTPWGIVENAIKYSPASLGYIVSMVIGYAGLRYLELSIVSPIQNASGALSMLCMLAFFLATGKISSFWDEFEWLDVAGLICVVAGVIALAIVEKYVADEDKALHSNPAHRKYRIGALALIFPLLYCLFDTIGTAADGIILDEETGLGLGEIDVIILYGLTFLLAGIVCWFVLLIKEKKPYNPFRKKELSTKGVAATCEEFGQVFYVYAMAAKPLFAAPIVASYCIVSLILSRVILKEKLKASQYVCILAVIIGIVLMGISEGLGS